MSTDTMDDLAFLTKAMSSISSSLDIQEALIETFDFLSKHFPIEAISLHQYSVRLESMKLLFLVQKGRFDFVETTSPVPKDKVDWMLDFHTNTASTILTRDNTKDNIANAHSRALDPLLPYRPRGYLVGNLRTDEEALGHLCLMGTRPDCFTEEHERKLSLLLSPFTLTMANLLKYRRTMEFQERLHAERDRLLEDLDILQDKTIVGEQTGLRETMNTVYLLRGQEVPALILGETGTGKELIADVIQRISPRRDKPFVKVNCGAIPESLVDSELFGYEKGAFTGASTSRPGRFEQAHGGTLFLDEIGELPLQAQVRLLRVLQNGTVERIGSTKSIEIDVRIIAATNRNLEAMMQEGTFREDLYYRLYVFPIMVPPLRERTEDIPELVQMFARQAYDKLGLKDLPQIPRNTLQRLSKYSWPGNVRELENLVKRSITFYSGGPLLLDELLPQDEGWYLSPEEGQNYLEQTIDARVEAVLEQHLAKLSLPPQSSLAQEAPQRDLATGSATVKTLEEATRDAISAALDKSNGKIHGPGGAAELLGINPSTLRSKMRKMGITFGQSAS